MPVRAPRICACGRVIPSGETCPCRQKADRERKARFDATRPTARARGYDRTWERERKAFLLSHPLCTRCGAPATLVDHIRPHRGNEALFRDKTNWQALCGRCHNSWKQARERKP